MSHEQKHPILQKLEEYLKNTPKVQLDEDWLDILKNSDMEAYYEKKYKDALERAKKLQETCDSTAVVGWCEYLFPGLKESEDEKMRKWIIDDIRYNMNNEPLNNSEYKEKAEKAIAWLEKQREQEPVHVKRKDIAWNEEDEKTLKSALWHISNSVSLGMVQEVDCQLTRWVKSLKNRLKNLT